jgi:hypothetical protein
MYIWNEYTVLSPQLFRTPPDGIRAQPCFSTKSLTVALDAAVRLENTLDLGQQMKSAG